jgi:two-component system CheB/CheR fusion protein
VTAASEGLGRGSTFTLRLPRVDAPKAVPSETDGRVGPATARRILVVDDNRDSATTMADYLRMHGHDVSVAFDGPEALVQAEHERPDVVLLDIGLPGMDGYEIADRLRNETAARGLTLIAMTGYGQPEDRERARAAGFDHHLTKPVDLKELQSLLQGSLLPGASR